MSAVPLSKEAVLKKSIGVSLGSLAILGLRDIKFFARPTTVYLMVSRHCVFNCAYCAQARESKAHTENLSRITWPEETFERVLEGLSKYDDYRRICFQVVNGENYFEDTLLFLRAIKEKGIKKPISISIRESDTARIRLLFSEGAERISLPIDVVSKKYFSRYRGGTFEKSFESIISAGRAFKGRITTHIIVGLDEEDIELYESLKKFFKEGILVSLFAFTPIKGTPLQDHPKVPIHRYRKFQFVRSLIAKNIDFEGIFEKGVLTGLKLERTKDEITNLLKDPANFITQGCPGCNRPFYNESPLGPIYNFPVIPKDTDRIVREFVSSISNGNIFFKV